MPAKTMCSRCNFELRSVRPPSVSEEYLLAPEWDSLYDGREVCTAAAQFACSALRFNRRDKSVTAAGHGFNEVRLFCIVVKDCSNTAYTKIQPLLEIGKGCVVPELTPKFFPRDEFARLRNKDTQ